MRITQEADYALRIVVFLSQKGDRASAREISGETSVSLRFALKILPKLIACSIVKSFKGANGGYILACPAAEITMKDVITAIDGDIYINRCLDNEACSRHDDKACCLVRKYLATVNKVIEDELDKIHINEIV